MHTIASLKNRFLLIHSIFEFYDYSERSVGEQRELYKPMHWKKRANLQIYKENFLAASHYAF